MGIRQYLSPTPLYLTIFYLPDFLLQSSGLLIHLKSSQKPSSDPFFHQNLVFFRTFETSLCDKPYCSSTTTVHSHFSDNYQVSSFHPEFSLRRQRNQIRWINRHLLTRKLLRWMTRHTNRTTINRTPVERRIRVSGGFCSRVIQSRKWKSLITGGILRYYVKSLKVSKFFPRECPNHKY